ncbi:succinylglutamate desuccinylase/aspartoacylase family protein [Shewanella sp. WXL01]|uniref:succinylglutamate desuccinylase/aspartoacylase family protein n=1 Tax=Shewanella sp. WXL01 TaxID=2709721 RepID=UPI0014384E90|nr:succinylglutamate desuccinylase/aspartoacylase family protein [Shewanella sp. WXL01]NKF49275.1 succinylglutamate desuccinylase/aspartoacylase family protein [Shewanella sp. WXL01]
MNIQQTSLHLGELATGHALTAPLFCIEPSKEPRFVPETQGGVDVSPAPSVYIQANVHGAEVQGNAVIYQLLKLLESYQVLGKIVLAPLANPLGINQKSGEFTLGRFDPITGVNWNREYLDHQFDIEAWYLAHQHLSEVELISAFKARLTESCDERLNNSWGISTGHRLAVTLQKMAHQADIVLDLHTGPKSCKHLYAPEYDKQAARFFSIPYTLVIPNEFGGAMDEAAFCPWWCLAEAAKAQGREFSSDSGVAISAFTLELASQERIDLADAKQDALGILAYLSHRGVIAEKVAPADMPRFGCYLKDYRKLHAPQSGMVEYCAELGQPLAAGEPLAQLLRVERYGREDALTSVSLPVDCVPILHFASASVHQGTELYKVMTNVFEL